MRHINLEIVRACEDAAIAAFKFAGRGDKYAADRAAMEAMRARLNKMDFAGQVVISEYEKDKSDGLKRGEYVGTLGIQFGGRVPSVGSVGELEVCQQVRPRLYDLAADVLDGTRLTSLGNENALSVLAVANENCLFYTPEFYMGKLAYGPKIKEKVRLSLADPLDKNICMSADALNKPVQDLMVCILDRPRHEAYVQQLRKLNVKIKLIQDCDITGAIATCLPDSGIDLLIGIGGSPEAILAACAIKCLGGGFQAQEGNGNILEMEDLVKGPCVFAATGVTNGGLLRGVRPTETGVSTNSVFMRSESRTVRWLETQHTF